MSNIIVTGIGASSIAMGGGPQAWLRLPKGVTPQEAIDRGWIVVAYAQLVLCQQVTYFGGPKSGIYWEPVQLSGLPEVDLP